MDLYARKIIAYKYSDKNNTQLTKKTFDAKYKQRQPGENLVFHSDQGANYTSITFQLFLKLKNVKQSYLRGEVPYDNSVCESFFKFMKTETDFRSEREFRNAVREYVDYYNDKRPHSVLRYQTANHFEEKHINMQATLPQD